MMIDFRYRLQLYLFYNIVTKHIINGYEAVLRPPSKVPCLMFISKDDPISPFDRNMEVMDAWKSNGIQVRRAIHTTINCTIIGHYMFKINIKLNTERVYKSAIMINITNKTFPNIRKVNTRVV